MGLGTWLYAYRMSFFFGLMNLFDAFIVATDLIALVLEGIIGDVPSLSILRALRMLQIPVLFLSVFHSYGQMLKSQE